MMAEKTPRKIIKFWDVSHEEEQRSKAIADQDDIVLEFATSKDTETAKLSYLVDPYLPRQCVVGFYGRGGTAKSSFLATLAAINSKTFSTLWVSAEEQKDWIKVRHTKSGGAENTLVVMAAIVARPWDTASPFFNVYEHLERAVKKAKRQFEKKHNPPRPLRLVVLDPIVTLTTWGKGESPNDDASVKKLLGHLQHLAEKHDVTFGIIGHSNKGKHDYFADTVAGSAAWVNSLRLSFVHAQDKRGDHVYVLRSAKTNLTTPLAAIYTTRPVHVLHKRKGGSDSVLCCVQLGHVVWGERESMRLFEAATGKDEGEGTPNNKQRIIKDVITTLLQRVNAGTEPVTRELVHTALGFEVDRKYWKEIDIALSLIHGIEITCGAHGQKFYKRKSEINDVPAVVQPAP
jgi:hypothetical protein